VLLPLTEAPAAAARPSGGAEATPTPGARVLVVEDEDQVRAVVARALAELGYEVREAKHARTRSGISRRRAAVWTWS
jgi:ActR/RegA family two-component response regulator